MTTTQTSNVVALKARPVFFTRLGATGMAVALWASTSTAEGAPQVEGKLGDVRVAGYVHQGPKGNFVSFIDSAKGKGEDGNYTQVATANVTPNLAGIPVLAIRLTGQTESVWADVSLGATQDLLVSAGLNLELQAQKKAEAAARRAAKMTAEPEAAAA